MPGRRGEPVFGMHETEFVLEESLGFLLSQAARAFARDLQARLQPYGVTPSQLCVLSCLWEEDGLSGMVLGERARFDPPTITGILDRLERDNLVTRRRAEHDRRVVTVHLTENGAELRAALPKIALASNARAATRLDGEQAETLARLLRQVIAGLG